MSLSCSCDFYRDFDNGEWYYDYDDKKWLIPFESSRRKRCCSCNILIDIGAICNEYPRLRYPHSNIESRILCGCDLDDSFSDEAIIPMAPHYHCERCAEIWLNLIHIGYECLLPNENMEESLKEYWQLSGFKSLK